LGLGREGGNPRLPGLLELFKSLGDPGFAVLQGAKRLLPLLGSRRGGGDTLVVAGSIPGMIWAGAHCIGCSTRRHRSL
jgi:hypothetical protein